MTTSRTSLIHGWLAAGLTGVTLLTAGCGGGGADPSTTQAAIRQHIPALVGDTLAAFDGVGDSAAFTQLGDSMDTLDGAYHLPFALGSTDETTPYALRQAMEEEEDPGEAIAQFLAEQIFIDANYEGDGVYRVPGELFCETEEGTDPECVDAVNQAQIKLRVAEAGDGIDIILRIGPSKSEPVAVELRSNSLAVAVDFGETREAIVDLAAIYGEDTMDLPDVWRGIVALTLTRHGEQDVSIAFAVREEVAIEANLESGRVAFSVGAKDPTLSVRANGIQRTLAVTLDVGRVQASVPFELIADYAAGQTLAVDWKGLSGSVTLSESESLTLTNIGWGDGVSSVTLDGAPIFTAELARFGLTISPVANAFPRFDFAPGFDMSVGFHLQTLVDAGEPEEIESWLLDETYTIALDGAGAALQPDADANGGAGGLAVLAGTLTLSSTAGPSTVTVAAGQCLVGEELLESGEHPVLGHLASGACN